MTRFLLLVVLATIAGCGGEGPKPAGPPADAGIFDKKAAPNQPVGKGKTGPVME